MSASWIQNDDPLSLASPLPRNTEVRYSLNFGIRLLVMFSSNCFGVSQNSNLTDWGVLAKYVYQQKKFSDFQDLGGTRSKGAVAGSVIDAHALRLSEVAARGWISLNLVSSFIQIRTRFTI